MDSDSEYTFQVFTTPSQIHKIPPLQGRWNPYLTSFFARVSDLVSRDNLFYHEDVLLENNNPSNFLVFFNDRENCTNTAPSHSPIVLLGSVGVGKTSFLKWWFSQNGKTDVCTRIDINHLSSRLASKKLGQDKHPIKTLAIEDLLNRLSKYEQFNSVLSKKIQTIRNVARGKNDPDFENNFINQSPEFFEKYPRFGHGYLLTCIISAANETFSRPVWIAVDNVDLESPNDQYKYILDSFSTYNQICEYSGSLEQMQTCFHLIVTARPETYRHWRSFFNDCQDISYPDTNVMTIANKRIRRAMDLALSAENFNFNFSIGEKKFKSPSELCSHIESSLMSCTKLDRWPWKISPTQWHLVLVNQNVRRFIKAWVHLVISGNFLDHWAFPEFNDEQLKASPYRYVRMLLRGPYNEFSGNNNIDGSGESPDSPLVFNMFGLPFTNDSDSEIYLQHYFIYIRIIQYLSKQEVDVPYVKLIDDLNPFFSEDYIDDAVRLLLWTRVIDEINIGARNIGGQNNLKNIELKGNAVIRNSKACTLYLDMLLQEYEYISAMALVSPQLRFDGLRFLSSQSESRAQRSATATYYFLESWFKILEINFSKYASMEIIKLFKHTFVSPNHSSRPWIAAVNATLHALKQQAKYYEDINKTINDIEELKTQGLKMIKSFLGNYHN